MFKLHQSKNKHVRLCEVRKGGVGWDAEVEIVSVLKPLYRIPLWDLEDSREVRHMAVY